MEALTELVPIVSDSWLSNNKKAHLNPESENEVNQFYTSEVKLSPKKECDQNGELANSFGDQQQNSYSKNGLPESISELDFAANQQAKEPLSIDRNFVRHKKALKQSSSSSTSSSATPSSQKRIRFSLNFELDDDHASLRQSEITGIDADEDDACFKLSPIAKSLDDWIESPQITRRNARNRSQSPEFLPFADDDDEESSSSDVIANSPPLAIRRQLISNSPRQVSSELHLADMVECDNLSFEESFLNEVHSDMMSQAEISVSNVQRSQESSADQEANRSSSGTDSELSEFLSLLRQDSLQNNQVALSS